VLAAGGGWLGFRLSREAERHAAERDHTTELIAKAQAELEEAHARLTAAHKELESFSYSVAHDLRAPLRRILGFSQALEEDNLAQLDAGGRDHVARIREASVRMGSLIDDLLGLARVTRQDLKRVQVDVTALATELVEELRGQEPGRRVAVEIEPGMQVYADQALTRVLLLNLLANAWKFTRNVPEARITVAWERKDRWSPDLFMVRDNGAGFEMAYAGKLFGAFQRMHTLAEFEGTGVGLATVRRIVERHGGTVRAEAAVGAGATFRFTLGR
jgi:light-regulated signal transduction histidine kinase (bacteriophytochrome)